MRKQLRKQDCWTLAQRISSPAWQSWAASREAALFFCLKISQPHGPCQLGMGFLCATYNQAYKICPAHVQPAICHRLSPCVTGQMIADHAYRKTPLLPLLRMTPLPTQTRVAPLPRRHVPRRSQCRNRARRDSAEAPGIPGRRDSADTQARARTATVQNHGHANTTDAVEYARATCQMVWFSGISLAPSKDCNT